MAFNTNQVGAANTGGSRTALFLPRAEAETLNIFHETAVFYGMVTKYDGRGALSHKHKITGAATIYDHSDPNAALTVNTAHFNTFETSADYPVVIKEEFNRWELLTDAWDSVSMRVREMGSAMADEMEQRILRAAVLAARISTPRVTGGAIGSTVTSDGMKDSANILKNSIYEGIRKLQDKKVNLNNLVLVLRPEQAMVLQKAGEIFNKDYGGESNGSFASKILKGACGLPLVITTNLPSTNVSSGPSRYQGDFRKTYGLIFDVKEIWEHNLEPLRLEMLDSPEHVYGNNAQLSVGLAESIMTGFTPRRLEAFCELQSENILS